MRVTLTPHTHWDREWYEPFAVFSERLEAMMDTLLDLVADGFPHFHLDGQTAMIDDYLGRRPERRDDVEALVAAGRLSAGPWVAQMDGFLTSGESQIRNLEMGLARARELGGALELGYMPDQFGHIGQMPQILRTAGIERAMVWRGVPFAVDRAAFRWRAPDGSEVLTEYMMFGYFNGESFEDALDPQALAAALKRSVRKMRRFAVGDRMIVMVGYDHAGPDATLPERLTASGPLLPAIDARIDGLASHVDGTDGADDLPVWTGELRSGARAHLLPNVYSARVHQKRERGRVEALLERYAEPLAALVSDVAPADGFREAWTLMCWNGAHDSVCGCSHDQVAIDVDGRYARVRATCEEVVADALTALGAQAHGGAGVIRFNPSPFERDGVPPFGYAVTHDVPEGEEVPVAIEPIDGGVLADGVPIRFLDEPDVGDLYTFCPAEPDPRPSPPDSVRVDGQDVVAAWDGLEIRTRVTRRAGEPFLRLTGVIDNGRPDHRLRLHAGLDGPVTTSVAGSPFEFVERPLVGEGSTIEAASPTWPGRHVVRAGSAAVLHEGVMEYEIADGEALAVTMLRCVGLISAEVLATRPWRAGPQTPTPDAQMLGETAFALGIWPSPPDDPADLLAGWERFALALVEAPATGEGDRPRAGSLLDLDLGGAQLSTVRGGGPLVRLWNPYGDRAVEATIDGVPVPLGPAKIVTVLSLPRSGSPPG